MNKNNEQHGDKFLQGLRVIKNSCIYVAKATFKTGMIASGFAILASLGMDIKIDRNKKK